MTWFAQVRHVMMKDLRQMRWPLFLYAAVVAVATVHAMTWFRSTSAVLEATMYIVVVVGMIICASVVQADSPTRSDAFWASRPLYPSAVLAAKLALAVIVIVGLPLIGQLAGLLSFGLPAHEVPAALGQSIAVYALWLLTALVVAGLTDDIRAFIAALVVIPLILFVILSVAYSSVWSPGEPADVTTRVALALLGAISGLTLLAFLYRTHDARRRMWVGGFISVSCVFLFFLRGSRPTRLEAPASVPRVRLHVELVQPDAPAQTRDLQLRVLADNSSDSDQTTFAADTVTVHLRDGSAVRVPAGPMHGVFLVTLHRPDLPVPQGVVWLGPHSEPVWNVLHIRLSGEQRALLSRGVMSVDLAGRVSVTHPRMVTTMPLDSTRSIVHEGTRLRIVRTGHSLDDGTVDVDEASVAQVRDGLDLLAFGNGQLSFGLLNVSRGEAMLLHQASGSGGGGWLVLPGTPVREQVHHLETSGQSGGGQTILIAPPASRVAGLARDDAWYNGASLLVVEWIPRGSYVASATVSAP